MTTTYRLTIPFFSPPGPGCAAVFLSAPTIAKTFHIFALTVGNSWGRNRLSEMKHKRFSKRNDKEYVVLFPSFALFVGSSWGRNQLSEMKHKKILKERKYIENYFVELFLRGETQIC